jgi:hypothetical protein
MSHALVVEHRPLPVAPRPFEAEVLGSWIGRLASRYRMSVQEFASAHQLELCIPNEGGWLMMQVLPQQSVDCLVALTRISSQQIKHIAVPALQAERESLFRYCPRCVFLNPLDVAAPIWRYEWLDPAVVACPVHAVAFNTLRPRAALACKNLDQLLKLVSRRQQQLRDSPLGSRASVVR